MDSELAMMGVTETSGKATKLAAENEIRLGPSAHIITNIRMVVMMSVVGGVVRWW